MLSLYARNSAGQKAEWKAKIRQRFREDIQKILSERYNFYAMTPYAQTDAEAFFKEHFQLLLGKVFTPYNDVHVKTTFYSMALVNHEKLPAGTTQEFRDRIIEENEAVLECVSDAFGIAPCALGDDTIYRVFRVRSSRAVKNEKMKQMNYPGPVGDYFCYFLDEEISLGSLDVSLIRKSYRHLSTFAHPCAPLYLSGRQVFSVLSV